VSTSEMQKLLREAACPDVLSDLKTGR